MNAGPERMESLERGPSSPSVELVSGVPLVRPTGSAEEVQRLAERIVQFVTELNTRDLERLERWYDERSVAWIPPAAARTGAKRIIRMFRVIFSQYSTLSWSPQQLYVINPTTVIVEMATSGLFLDGRKYDNSILMLVRFSAEGTILFSSDYFKNTAIFSASAP